VRRLYQVSDAQPAWSAGDLHLGADISSADGTKVGTLERILVESGEYGVKAIVVKESRRFSGHWLSPGSMLMNDEFIVPREAIRSVSHERIDLNLHDGEVRKLAPYLSYGEKPESLGEELEDQAGVFGGGPELPHWVQEIANKPLGEIEIDQGENVMLGHTGRKLGEVKDVLVDGSQLVGVVLKPQGLFTDEVILPRRFLDRSDDLALFANLTEEDLRHLKPFRPAET
jgi:sporulation protein YlmC with PRC-barrel domain